MKVLKKTGNYLQYKALRRLSVTIFLTTIFALVAISEVPFFSLYVDLGRYEGIRALFLLILLLFTVTFYRSYAGYRRGYEGETTVSKILSSTLGIEYFLINDVNIHDEYGNIDHVVRGPTECSL